jgi:hypothetical protein
MNKQESVVSQELPIDPESKTKSAYQDIREKPQGDEAPDLQLSRRTDPALGREIDVQSWTGLPLLPHSRGRQNKHQREIGDHWRRRVISRCRPMEAQLVVGLLIYR